MHFHNEEQEHTEEQINVTRRMLQSFIHIWLKIQKMKEQIKTRFLLSEWGLHALRREANLTLSLPYFCFYKELFASWQNINQSMCTSAEKHTRER